MAVTRWVFDYSGSAYTFERNPDRDGGDSFWRYEQRGAELNVLGASLPTYQVDGFNGAIRTLRFSAITGTMMRVLETYYLANAEIQNCRDHLYSTTAEFNCIITSFVANIRPSVGSFPGSGEDTWNITINLMRTS